MRISYDVTKEKSHLGSNNFDSLALTRLAKYSHSKSKVSNYDQMSQNFFKFICKMLENEIISKIDIRLMM